MGGNELHYINEAFASNFIAPVGHMVDRFEREFSSFTGIPHCVAVNSGTSAIHLALRHFGLSAGDTVYASTLTFIGGIAPILYQNATPIFIDSDPSSWNMDVALLAQALEDANRRNNLPKVVIPTDLYGQSCDADAIRALCDQYGVKLLIDAAESVGTHYRGRHAGHAGHVAAYSFNGNKIMTTSSGGMLASHDKKIIDEARNLSHPPREPTSHYEHITYGYNYRMSNILAAIGVGQLEVVQSHVNRRREIFAHYQLQLGSMLGISFMPEMEYGRSNRWLTVMLIDKKLFGSDREMVRLALEENNIEARPVWKPMHLQPLFKDSCIIGGSVSENLFGNGLCLPSSSSMTDSDIDRVCEVIRKCHTAGC